MPSSRSSRPPSSRDRSVGAIARRELRELVTVNPSDRPWQLPFAVAVAVGLPLLIGAWFGRLGLASLGAIGAMTIVYLPRTPLAHRLVTLMAAAFGMTACYALGQLSHLVPAARVPVIGLVTVLVTMACRYYRVVPPGALFFVMATAIGAWSPGQLADMPMRLGVFALGTMGAVIVGFLYSVHIRRFRKRLPVQAPPEDWLNAVVIEPLIIGLFVGLSLAAAQVLALEKPYWVPVSCLAVIQGVSLRAVWTRQAQRIVGTLLGLGATWVLVRYATSPWEAAIAITLLTFCIEVAIVRQYAFAAIFITPLAILLAEISTRSSTGATALMTARLADTVVGALIGLLGGFCLHNAALRRKLRRLMQDGPDQA